VVRLPLAPDDHDRHGHVGDVAFDGRRNLELNVGMACNNACVFCVSGLPEGKESRRWLPLDKAQRELKVAFDAGCRSVGFLGGEPTIYPDLLPAVAYARELGYSRVAICSNGMKYDDASFVRALVDAGVTRFAVSVHSHRPDLEEELVKVPDALERKVAGLRNLLVEKAAGRLPDNVSINPVLSKKTAPHIVDFIAFFVSIGLDDIRFNFIRPEGKAEIDADPACGSALARSIVPTFTEVKPWIRRAIVANETRFKIHLTFGEMPICALPDELLRNAALLRRYVGEFQDLTTDVALFAAPRREEGKDGLDRFNWQDRKRAQLKQPVAACASCRYGGTCFGVAKGYVSLHGDREFHPL
jgi:hypothetical protein